MFYVFQIRLCGEGEEMEEIDKYRILYEEAGLRVAPHLIHAREEEYRGMGMGF